jgi:hypothetical protein
MDKKRLLRDKKQQEIADLAVNNGSKIVQLRQLIENLNKNNES